MRTMKSTVRIPKNFDTFHPVRKPDCSATTTAESTTRSTVTRTLVLVWSIPRASVDDSFAIYVLYSYFVYRCWHDLLRYRSCACLLLRTGHFSVSRIEVTLLLSLPLWEGNRSLTPTATTIATGTSSNTARCVTCSLTRNTRRHNHQRRTRLTRHPVKNSTTISGG